MVGVLQFFHYGQASSSRKLSSPKRHNDGFEAPRNSLEFPTEASHSNQIFEDDIPYSCELKYHATKVNSHSDGVPIRSLIEEEVPRKPKDICNKPSVVARLMGVDALSSEINPMTDPQRSRNAQVPRKGSTGATLIQDTSSYVSNSTMPKKKELFTCDIERGPRQHNINLESEKPKTREHPQEEELQKFKKEFQAWQELRMWESSRSPELGRKRENLLAKRISGERYCSLMARPNIATENREILRHGGFMSKQTNSIMRDYYALKDSAKCNVCLLSTQDQQDISASSRRIVILKSFSETNDDDDAMSWLGSPEIMQKENIKDFLEQVRKKLESEMQGKSRFDSQRMSDPRQTVQRITNHFTRSATTEDYKNALARFGSTKSQRNEVQLNGKISPQLITKETKKLLSKRLKNVLKGESYVQFPPTAKGRQNSSSSSSEPETFRPMHYLDDNGNKVSFWDDKRSISPTLKSSRHDNCHSAMFDDELRPPSLIRSFSAPVAGTSFGKPLVEDQHSVRVARVLRRHEAEDVSTEVTSRRKDSFNIKNKVSILRQNFPLKGKLFGKKAQLMDKKGAHRKEFLRMSDTLCTPSVVLNSGFAEYLLENSTEVPPSPVSVCSTSYGDICRPGYPSPVSPFDATFAEEHSSSQVSEDLGTIIPELDRSELPDGLDEEREKTESVNEVIIEEDDSKAYIREILTISGLLERQSLDQLLSGWDSLSKPISKWVFDRVEETCGRTSGVDNPAILLCHGRNEISRRMLFDLLNEALLKFVQAQMTSSTMRNLFPDRKRLPFNKGVLDNLWDQIQTLTKPLEENSHSLEPIVTWDLNRIPWPSVYRNCTDAVGMEMEASILRDLISELVHDLVITSDGAMR